MSRGNMPVTDILTNRPVGGPMLSRKIKTIGMVLAGGKG